MKPVRSLLWAAFALLICTPATAQNITAPDAVVPAGITVEAVMVQGATLEGNLEGNAATREVMVVLPPSYATSPDRRYPVVYYLHGFAISGRDFYDYMQVPTAVAQNAAQGREFIVVVPDTLTAMGGSMYGNSATTGHFRDFIATDLVAYIDANYRTIATRAGRGLAGHSMGGHGTWVVGMTHPQVFNAIWAQSACCLSARRETPESAAAMAAVPRDGVDRAGFGMRAGLASAVAWSPNPEKPPFFVDFPLAADGSVDQSVLARWASNAPLVMVATHLEALNSFAAIGADVGTADGLIGDGVALHQELDGFGVAHRWETYEGTHTDKIGARFASVVLPFMAQHLTMGAP